jgi:hypothetical protein
VLLKNSVITAMASTANDAIHRSLLHGSEEMLSSPRTLTAGAATPLNAGCTDHMGCSVAHNIVIATARGGSAVRFRWLRLRGFLGAALCQGTAWPRWTRLIGTFRTPYLVEDEPRSSWIIAQGLVDQLLGQRLALWHALAPAVLVEDDRLREFFGKQSVEVFRPFGATLWVAPAAWLKPGGDGWTGTPGEAIVIGPDIPAPVPLLIGRPSKPPNSQGPAFKQYWASRKKP